MTLLKVLQEQRLFLLVLDLLIMLVLYRIRMILVTIPLY
uniref:Uncharacterized protein n=1 Tax=virus sp. ctML55 TaxID=2827627 RepID=A0A8S5RI26_9VIRU|nr:MAG TPA: hypothetical protein [virus sp. ctML55]